MKSDIIKQRAIDLTNTAVRNIMSGNNCCDKIRKAADANDGSYFSEKIFPVMATVADELETAWGEMHKASAAANAPKHALQAILSNLGASVHINDAEILQLVKEAAKY